MVFIQSLILIGLCCSFFFGQLWRLNIFDLSFPAIDIFIVLTTITALINPRPAKHKPLLYFLVWAWLDLLINYLVHGMALAIPVSYLLRLSCLLILFAYPPQVSDNIKRLFILCLIANILFGLFQYFFWPDFTYFKALGWDDHLNRLVSTYFDPTFTGLIYLLFLIYIEFSQESFSRITFYALRFTIFIAIALTYSRSTFLSLLVAGLFVCLKTKKIRPLLSATCLVLFFIVLLPRPAGEGTKLERTSSINAKIVNYQQALELFTKSPLIGVGYNNLPNIINQPSLHSHSGFDSSLLTILVTTGIIGLGLLLIAFFKLFVSTNLFQQTIMIAIFTHSLFANSLLYPFTLVFLMFALSCKQKTI